MDSTAIRALRLRLGLTQEGMARACNVSVSSVRAWEQGLRSPSGAAVRLLQTLGSEKRRNPDGGTPSRKLRRNLPTVATVSGVRVMIFYNDHAPPHVHLSKGDMDVVVQVDAPSIPPWAFTRAERRAVLAWVKSRAPALRSAWERACSGESPGSIP